MKIGLIIYSLSNHTLSVANKLKENLALAGQEVILEKIEIIEPAVLNNEDAPLKSKPAATPYDVIVFGSPVRGGVLPPPMKKYFEQVDSLAGKKVAILVTGFFPAKWGRNQVTAQMIEILEGKGAQICGQGSVGWFSLNRKQQIAKAVNSLVNCLEKL